MMLKMEVLSLCRRFHLSSIRLSLVLIHFVLDTFRIKKLGEIAFGRMIAIMLSLLLYPSNEGYTIHTEDTENVF